MSLILALPRGISGDIGANAWAHTRATQYPTLKRLHCLQASMLACDAMTAVGPSLTGSLGGELCYSAPMKLVQYELSSLGIVYFVRVIHSMRPVVTAEIQKTTHTTAACPSASHFGRNSNMRYGYQVGLMRGLMTGYELRPILISQDTDPSGSTSGELHVTGSLLV